MTSTFFVVAPVGKMCPKELSRERITDAMPVEVPNTPYYRQRIEEGSLLLTTEYQWAKHVETTASSDHVPENPTECDLDTLITNEKEKS